MEEPGLLSKGRTVKTGSGKHAGKSAGSAREGVKPVFCGGGGNPKKMSFTGGESHTEDLSRGKVISFQCEKETWKKEFFRGGGG